MKSEKLGTGNVRLLRVGLGDYVERCELSAGLVFENYRAGFQLPPNVRLIWPERPPGSSPPPPLGIEIDLVPIGEPDYMI